MIRYWISVGTDPTLHSQSSSTPSRHPPRIYHGGTQILARTLSKVRLTPDNAQTVKVRVPAEPPPRAAVPRRRAKASEALITAAGTVRADGHTGVRGLRISSLLRRGRLHGRSCLVRGRRALAVAKGRLATRTTIISRRPTPEELGATPPKSRPRASRRIPTHPISRNGQLCPRRNPRPRILRLHGVGVIRLDRIRRRRVPAPPIIRLAPGDLGAEDVRVPAIPKLRAAQVVRAPLALEVGAAPYLLALREAEVVLEVAFREDGAAWDEARAAEGGGRGV